MRFIPAGAGNTIGLQYDAKRFIPAGAGNTLSRCNNSFESVGGSSPRARGTRVPCRRCITAGSSPRARGTLRVHRQLAPNGSSPRARGTRWLARHATRGRFIPAGAGNTNQASSCCQVPVHPRGRGEHPRAGAIWRLMDAQPVHPRGRGEHRNGEGWIRGWRFIPAGAGNTAVDAREHAGAGSSPRARGTLGYYNGEERRSVHPRGRGEHGGRRVLGAARGSSPRARGTPSAGRPSNGVFRFIPAGAGNTGRVCLQ